MSVAARWLKLAVGGATTTGFVWLFARELDLEALGPALADVPVSGILFALGFLAAGYAARVARWWRMLHALEPALPPGACVGPLLASVAVNNVLPFRAGDALRVVGFRRTLRSPAMRVLGTLIVERVVDLFVLLGIFFFGLIGLPNGALPRDIVRAAMWAAGAGLAVTLALPLLPRLLAFAGRRLSRRRALADRFRLEAVLRYGAQVAEAFEVLRSPGRALTLVGLSIVAWACEGTVFALTAIAVRAESAPAGPWFAMATGTLATLLPSTPGYIGTFDYFAAQGLEAYGAEPALAAIFALAVHIILWAPVTITGLAFLLFRSAFHKE